MDKEAIADLLEQKYQALFNFLEQQDPEKWETGPEGKWSTGEHILHLLKANKMINTAMSLPKFMLKMKYGKSNRDVREYQTVVDRYLERLSQIEPGRTFQGSAPNSIPTLKDKPYLLDRLKTECKKLQYKTTKRWSDKDLNNLILPHPLMGKMPVRELVMWSAYHVEHHTKTLIENY